MSTMLSSMVVDVPSTVVSFDYPRGVHLLNGLLKSHQKAFDADQLMESAKRRSGLSDFGDMFFVEPLQRLVRDINESCDFHPLGSFLYQQKIKLNLSNRLWSQYWLQREPAIEQKLPPALLITGLQRTGTTFLQRLLGSLPEFRGVISWEIVNPVPNSKRKHYFGKIQARLGHRALNYLSPQFRTIHSAEYNSLEEEVVLMEHSFMSSVIEASMHVPQYSRWLEQQDQRPAYEDLKMWLQLLLWRKQSQSHLLLKSPHHMEYLDTFTSIFPDVHIVQTHRTPVQTLGSFCSMVEEGRKVFQPNIDREQIGAHWLRKNQRLIQHCQSFKEKRPDMFTDISYSALIEDPIQVVKQIYDRLGLMWTEQHTTQALSYCQKHKKNKYGKHVYNLEKYGLSKAQVEYAFSDYLNNYQEYLA
ncbi:MAG: sulfotransferase [Bacteroidota bacterium]